jgi:glycosyltransferase involved in cell wall biosynthesis
MDPGYEAGLVSVIVPTYNRVQFIKDAVESVRNQVYRPIELIVVDDGSTDNTPNVIGQWSRRWSDNQLRVNYYRQGNQGAPVARNRGLVESTGEFIQFLDSDDLLHPQKLDLQVELLRKQGSDFVFSSTGGFEDQIDWDTDPTYTSTFVGEYSYLLGFLHRLRVPQTWSTEGGIYRREACLEIGPWSEDLAFDQDWEYNIRFLISQPDISEHPRIMTLKRKHSYSRVGHARRNRRGARQQLGVVAHVESILERKNIMSGSKRNKMREGLALHYILAAHSALKLGDRRTARNAAKAALRIAPSSSLKVAALLFQSVSLIPIGGTVYREIINPIRKTLRPSLP